MELPEATKIRLQDQHRIIDDLINRMTNKQWDEQVISGKWNIHQQLAHLVRYQEIFFGRIQQIMGSFSAVFKPYTAEEDVEFERAAQAPVPELLNRLTEMRETLIRFYLSLNSGELVRKGRHTRLGNLSIALWAEFFLLHEAHHIFEIFRMSRLLLANNESEGD